MKLAVGGQVYHTLQGRIDKLCTDDDADCQGQKRPAGRVDFEENAGGDDGYGQNHMYLQIALTTQSDAKTAEGVKERLEDVGAAPGFLAPGSRYLDELKRRVVLLDSLWTRFCSRYTFYGMDSLEGRWLTGSSLMTITRCAIYNGCKIPKWAQNEQSFYSCNRSTYLTHISGGTENAFLTAKHFFLLRGSHMVEAQHMQNSVHE